MTTQGLLDESRGSINTEGAPGEITIRPAAAHDLSAILKLYAAAGISDGQDFTLEEALAQWATLVRNPAFRVFVAEVQSKVVGTYELLVMDNLAKRGRRSGIVEDVAVDPACQGRGVGRAMMQHAFELCRQAQCYKLVLSSNSKREAAHRFYEALGLEKHGYSFRLDLE